jgi:hypothetical protein
MSGRRTKVLMIVATIAPVVFCLWLVQHVRERRKAAEREGYYKAVLTQYTGEFKPGMTRGQVEQHLQRDGSRFQQMCCVVNSKGEHVSLVGTGWDDLVKIGEESTPWFCSENNVYIAFEFSPKSPGELSKTNASDILKRGSVFQQLEGCL